MRIRQIRFVRLLLGVTAAALGLLALALVATAAPGPSGLPGPVSSAAEVSASATGKALRRSSTQRKRGPRGRRGKRGPRGRRGAAGAQGSPIIRQPISINWQNNAWKGRATQEFIAPGIGTGNVTCRPPYDNGPTNREPGGTQWVQLFPNDSTGTNAETVMWTTRFGGPPSQSGLSNVRTAKLLNTIYGPSFYEGMNTKSDETVDPESQGMFVGIVSARNKTTGADIVPPTTFVLSWHWTFANLGGDPSQNRCYVAGNFYTGR
jgi:hypothetical protein